MDAKGEGRVAPAESRRDRPALRWLTSPVKLLALAVGVVVSVVAMMSVVGLFTEQVWIQALVGVGVAIVVPLVLADRLLPDDGSSRPGLVSDVAAVTWMGGATTAVLLGTSVLQAPLTAQAARFDEHGWSRAAWATRWAAGSGADPADAAAQDDAMASRSEPAAEAPASRPEGTRSDGEATVIATVATTAATEAPVDAKASADAKAEPKASSESKTERHTLDPAELFAAWAPSVVTISVDTPFGPAVGTGFVIDERGTIATNHHVVQDASSITVKLFDGTKAERVRLLESNADDDLALLRIELPELPPPVHLGTSAEVVVGESVVVIGNPIGLEHTMTDGLVSSRRVYEGKRYIQMSAPVSPGNSGGPVFDRYGDVIGVTVAKLWGENLNLAIPIDVLQPMIKSEYPDARGFGDSRW